MNNNIIRSKNNVAKEKIGNVGDKIIHQSNSIITQMKQHMLTILQKNPRHRNVTENFYDKFIFYINIFAENLI